MGWINPGRALRLLNLTEKHSIYLNRSLDKLSEKFKNYILLSDFISVILSKYINAFCESYNLKLLIQEPWLVLITFWQTILGVCNLLVVDTGLSDFYRLTVTGLKTYSGK